MITVRPEAEYLAELAGKRVVLAGPAAYLTGQGRGLEIDAHDVVVRMNLAYERDVFLAPDYGTRTDVLYSILAKPGRRAVGAADVERMATDGVRWIVSKWGEGSAHQNRWRSLLTCDGSMRVTVIDPEFINAVRVDLMSEPHTGPLAIAHLLASDLASLTVVGCDFYATGYQAGYGGLRESEVRNITEYAASSHKGEWTWVSRAVAPSPDRHAQMRLLARLAAEDSRLVLDAPLVERIGEAVPA